MSTNGTEPSGATVIVATYENPRALALSLAGLARQTTSRFEIVVADDGSGEATATVVREWRERCPVSMRHVWQEDRGLRKGRILNRALAEAAQGYVIFLDGDIVPSDHLVASHLGLARPGAYLSGSCVLLGARASARLTPDAVGRGQLDGLRACRPGNRRARRLLAGCLPGLAALFDEHLAPATVGFHGGHASVARADALAIGGFDERLGRFEDKDFGHRLRLLGLRGESVRYRIPAWHVHHERPYATSDLRERSRAQFAANVEAGRVRTEHGLPPLDRDSGADTRCG